jgi:glycosyltransferase involved in cell wall biosynthesis
MVQKQPNLHSLTKAKMNICPVLADLPPPPSGKSGWPWTEESLNILADTLDTTFVDFPRMSIVTPSFNQGNYIEETIRSVLLQGYPNIEYIVIDGGSTDETLRILKKYEKWLTHWVSEEDRGQSNAINKGLKVCTGKIFNWLNSDDLFLPNALHHVAKEWTREPDKIIAGATVNFDHHGGEDLHSPNAITLENFVNWTKARDSGFMWQQASTFLPLELVNEVGGVREDLRFSMDHFLMIDLLERCEVSVIPDVLAKFRLHDESKTVSAGHLVFSLERLKHLRQMTDLHELITIQEIVQLEVSVLITLAYEEKYASRYQAGFMYFIEALTINPIAAILMLLRKSKIGRLIRDLRNTS